MKSAPISTLLKRRSIPVWCLKWIVLAFILSFNSCDPFPAKDINHQARVDSLLDRADHLNTIQNTNRAKLFLDSAYARFPEAGILDRYRKYQRLLTYYSDRNNTINLVIAEQYIDSLFLLFDREGIKNKYRAEYALAHLNRGDHMQFRKNYDEAYSYYFRGKILIDPIDKCKRNPYTARVASMTYEQKNYAKAAGYYKQAYQEAMECPEGDSFDNLFVNRQGYLSNVAQCYSLLNRLDSAVYFYDLALQFIQQNEAKFPTKQNFIEQARGVIYGNQGAVYRKMRDYKRAIPVLQESIRINSQKNRYNFDAQFSQATLSRVYLEDNQMGKARSEMEKLQASLDTLSNDEALLRLYSVEWQFWDKLNQPGKSLSFLKKYLKLKEVVDRNSRNFDKMDQVLLKLENEHNTELLLKKEELNRLYLLATIAISLLALTIAFLIWLSWKRTRRNLLKLADLNRQIIGRNTQLQTTLTILEKSHQENARLLKVVAHDLRTPVGSISMAADLLMEGELKVRKPEFFLSMIKTSSADALDLIDNLLHSNTLPDKKERVELREFLTSCVDVLQLKAETKKQSIDLKTDAIDVFIDRQKMWRVIANLLTNAIKFSPPGSTITIRTKKSADRVRLMIKDEGIGIPAELKDKVFSPYSEAKRTGTSGEKTFGLGLSISRQIIEAHDGKLWFESQENQGTTFYIEFPVH
ncbi:ATP-binding protein [Larkinella rosea]|uniref:histidine kinase n=1 Tax=Larkinella rosea TaxID=2025312 RepID=A0A3P1BK65_9BACT|nr:tetratricopeptide repeat-containing sensor histidine kinase [Larkinella rosea]RRB00904.1 sensor histidine kinase [Larkinella rosea]